MIKPQPGEMHFNDLKELSGYYMFVAACLQPHEREALHQKWEDQGGYAITPWWKFVMENTRVELDIQ